MQDFNARRCELLSANRDKVEKQHAKGRLSARERVEKLLDAGSFVESDSFKTDAGLVAGYGLVASRPVYLLAQDICANGAGMNDAQAEKMLKTLDMSEKTGAPVVVFAETEGFSVKEGAKAMKAYSRVFARLARLSGVCPIISVLNGPCMGIAAHFAGLSDVAVGVKNSALLMPVSPLVLNAVQGTNKKEEELFGADVALAQGAVSLSARSEGEAIDSVKQLLMLLPSYYGEATPTVDSDDLNRLIDGGETGLSLALSTLDRESAVELYQGFGKGAHTLLGRLGSYACGVVALQGRLDASAMMKAARLVRLCNSFNIPVVSLIDSDGISIESEREQGWLLRAQAQMIFAYAGANVAKLAIFNGNAIGAGYFAVAGASVADISYAWPQAFAYPISKEAAVQTFETEKLKEEGRNTLEEAFAEANDGFAMAKNGLCDDVIDPKESRKHLIAALEVLLFKDEALPNRKHGNWPM